MNFDDETAAARRNRGSSMRNVNTGSPYRLDTTDLRPLVEHPRRSVRPASRFEPLSRTTISEPGVLARTSSFTQDELQRLAVLPGAQNKQRSDSISNRQRSTGVLPPSSLFTFSDQQIRGYNRSSMQPTPSRPGPISPTASARPPYSRRSSSTTRLSDSRRLSVPQPVHQSNHRISGRLDAGRRLRPRHSVRRAAARFARSNRFRQGRLRDSYQFSHRAELLGRNYMSIRLLLYRFGSC